MDTDIHGDCQVVSDVEIKIIELMYCQTSRANQIQDVMVAVSVEVDMLCEVEAFSKFQEIRGDYSEWHQCEY